MKLTNEICISFLRGSGWLYNHDKEITISEHNKAIDDFVSRLETVSFTKTQWDLIKTIAEQLKEGGENE